MAPLRGALDSLLNGHEPYPVVMSTAAGSWSPPTGRPWRWWGRGLGKAVKTAD